MILNIFCHESEGEKEMEESLKKAQMKRPK